MILACPNVLSSHSLGKPDLFYLNQTDTRFISMKAAYKLVSCCNGNASLPVYATCMSAMMSSLDLALLRLVISPLCKVRLTI